MNSSLEVHISTRIFVFTIHRRAMMSVHTSSRSFVFDLTRTPSSYDDISPLTRLFD